MVLTRSQTNRADDEERRTFVAGRAAAEPNPTAEGRRRQREADAHARAALGLSPQEPESQPGTSDTYVLEPERPATPTMDTSDWRIRLNEHLRRNAEQEVERENRNPVLPSLRTATATDADEPRAPERSAHRGETERSAAAREPAPSAPRAAPTRGVVTFDERPVRPLPPASERSFASNATEVRKREAELRAAEELAELQKRRLQLEEDLVRKRLATQIAQIEEQGSRAGGSIPDSTRRVDDWLREQRTDGAETSRRLRDRSPRRDDDAARPPRRLRSPTPHRDADDTGRAARRPRSPTPTRRDAEPATPRRPRATTSPRRDTQTPGTTRERSSSRGTAIDRLADHLQNMMRPPPRQVYELPTYNGEPGEWLTFYNSYVESTTRYKFSDYENVSRLRYALKGEARQCVQHMLASSTRPDLIVRILKKNFGRSDLLIDRAIEELRRLPPIGPSAADLNLFAIKVTNIVSTLVDLDKRSYGANPLIIREVTERLSPHLRSRWCAYARDNAHRNENELSLMAEFLLMESDNEMEFSHARAPSKRSAPVHAPAPATYDRNVRRAEPRTYPSGGGAIRKVPIPQNRTYATQQRASVCLCCGGGHKTTECRRVASMNVGTRWDWARTNRVCFRCLDSKHRREHCRAKGCGETGCPHSHHRLLHEYRTQPQPPRPTEPSQVAELHFNVEPIQRAPPTNEIDARGNVEQSLATSFTGATVLLKVIPVVLSGPRGEVRTHALLDQGSTISLVDAQLADALGLRGPASPLYIRGVGNMNVNQESQNVKAGVRGLQGGPTYSLNLRTVRELGLRGQRVPQSEITRYEHLKDLNEACYEEAVPRILIGADHWHLMVPRELRMRKRNEPAAIKCDLGWVVFGTAPSTVSRECGRAVQHCYYKTAGDLDALLKWHFSVEALGVLDLTKTRPEDVKASEIVEETLRKVPGPRYEVGQLWQDDNIKTPPTYAMAFSRLRNLERKMDRNSDFADKYIEQVDNLIEKGYAKRLSEPMPSDRQWFLPHFAAENVNKPGKIRLVFDAAAVTQGRSLNSYLLEGPDLLQPLLGILYRFREGRYAVTSDLEEMFLRVRLREQDQPAQMFLWRGRERQAPPDVYVMTSIIFGARSSPFIAHSVRNRNARDNADKYPDAVAEIVNNHYMDDYVASYADKKTCVSTALQVDASHKEGGFKLRSWSTNCDDLLREIPAELRASAPSQIGGRIGGKTQKILGLIWNAADDTLGYNTSMIRVPAEVRDMQRGPTKREALSAVMSVYDPLGLISQYTITMKIQLQRLWSLRLGWDEPLPEDEKLQFQRWLGALKHVAELRVPRQYPGAGGAAEYELHVFSDASSQAYAVAAYWRITTTDNVEVSLAAAKAKVAPTKPLSIPRLELQAALIGARLQRSLQEQHRMRARKVVLWTDSKTVLHWVRDDARRYNVYVSHRLGEIAELTDPGQWRWVPTRDNPADDATRADSARAVRDNDRWYTGPDFLLRPEPEWPREPEVGPDPEPNREVLEIKQCCVTVHEDPPLPNINKFSNYDRLIGATARMLQFIEKLKTKKNTDLSLRHITGAEHLWFQQSQRQSFPEELRSLHRGETISTKSRLYKLDPELCSDGVMRMRGRINAAPAPTLQRKPIILDGRNPFVRLLIQRAHKRALHANNERVVNDLRQIYWILHLRPTVRAVASACRLCVLRRAQPRVPALGDLPLARLQPYRRAFTYAAVDYFGPLTVTVGRRHEKRWVALFTCLTTRAVHLEVVHTLSTSSAIMALRRMGARRGYPHVIYSDNATCFRGADVELRAAYEDWLPALKEFGLQERMEWRFIPPGAPNQGGAWERLVRSVKVALTATLHTKAPRDEVLRTLLAEAENTINARPLTHVPVDPQDDEALTPSHFLLGGPIRAPLIGPCEEADRRDWRASQALADHFWARWVREYLPTLAPRQSSAAGERQLQVGDYVLIVDPTLPRNVWPRGIVEAVYPGPDGAVRSADVRTRGGVFRRPTRKLAVLPLQPGGAATAPPGGRMLRTAGPDTRTEPSQLLSRRPGARETPDAVERSYGGPRPPSVSARDGGRPPSFFVRVNSV